MMTTDVAAGDAVQGHMRRTLRELAQLDGLSASIGGFVAPRGDRMVITELHGLASELLRGVVIRPGIGLGGVALHQRRPVAVADYVGATSITHHFDHAVQADRIKGALAVPVAVKGDIRAVVYGATRGPDMLGPRTLSTATIIARRLGHDIEVEEDVQRRLRQVLDAQRAAERDLLNRSERVEVNAELVAIAAVERSPELRDRLLTLSQRLSGGAAHEPYAPAVRLSGREADVLAQLAAGYTNAEIAERLCILPTTVKTHLRNTMRKLGARNRVETVAAARNAGLLP